MIDQEKGFDKLDHAIKVDPKFAELKMAIVKVNQESKDNAEATRLVTAALGKERKEKGESWSRGVEEHVRAHVFRATGKGGPPWR